MKAKQTLSSMFRVGCSMFDVLLTLLLLFSTRACAATHYVWQSSPGPAPPYTNWATAATNIQDAVNVAAANDVVMVTNGVYPGGVAVNNPLPLVSVNGPQFTVIDGGGTNRCAYLGQGASLTGFTLTNGVAVADSGGGVWCLSTSAVLTNCTLTGNSAYSGGGVHGGTLYNCTLTSNSADYGGGADGGTLYNCTLVGNLATGDHGSGGGATGGTLHNCTLVDNSAYYGGGADSCTLYNCALTGNSAPDAYGYFGDGNGGGAAGGTLFGCVLTGNSARAGGGAAAGELYNCTLTGNSASYEGGGTASSTLNNCIVYDNTAPISANYVQAQWGGVLNFCCTTPIPTNGFGNIALDPQLASASHLSANSPCRGAGDAWNATGTDIDGEPWGNPPSIGCDEYHAGAVTGPLTVSLLADYTNVAVGYPVTLTALIEGRTTESMWEFGEGLVVSNRPYASHAWAAPGDYAVVLRAYNESLPAGVSATATIHVVAQPVHYVAAGNVTPVSPYTSWATAATNIQDAVDAANRASLPPGSALVLVSNGVYAHGGRALVGTMTNRVAVDKPVTLRSLNGPAFTFIDGGGTNRCASLIDNSSLTGFTLTNGAADSGGGVWCASTNAVLTNCTLTGNSAYYGGGACGGTLYNCTLTSNSADYGGGAWADTLYNCTLNGNSATSGGGADGCTLYNCTLTGNSAYGSGGGAGSSKLYNCIVYFNTATPGGANYDSSSSLNYCCTTPLPPGTGNISAEPRLTDSAHVRSDSPCIGAGDSNYTGGNDFDGEAWANPPSIGCDEFHAGPITGPLAVTLAADYTNAAAGFALHFSAQISGHALVNFWDFDDGTFAINEPFGLSHSFATPGRYTVTLWAYNDSYPEGVSTRLVIHVDNALHYASAASQNPVTPYTSWATAATNIQDAVDAAGAGGTVLVANGLYTTGGRRISGEVPSWLGGEDTNRVTVDKTVSVRSVNGPEATIVDGLGEMRCVYLANGAVFDGFTLTNGYAWPGGAGVYCQSTNAFLTNCVIMDSGASSRGGGANGGTLSHCTLSGNWVANGYPETPGVGGGAYLCILYDCTLTGNHAQGWGGGAYGCTLYNSTVSRNSAGFYGGGAEGGTLYNCTLTGNSASRSGGGAAGVTLYNCTLTGNSAQQGGGAYASPLYNCTLTGNSAGTGGGAYQGTLNNCTVYFNSATNGANYYQDQYGGVLIYCCTTPMPTNGVGNITNAPLVVDYDGGNLRLQSNSPCINAGNNAYAPAGPDLDGNPRIVSGTVDMGAYEYQGTGSVISYAWLQQYGLPTDGTADFGDTDADGLNNWQEWRCGTCPTDANSALRLLSPRRTGPNITVSWQSVGGVNYFLESATNLSATPCFTCVATNLPGQPGTTSYTDTAATNAGPYLYRVGLGH